MPSSFMANLEPEAGQVSIERFKRESPVRMFSLMNYDRLSGDIASGRGEYLDSLYSMYGVTTNAEKATLLKRIRDVQKKSSTIEEFSAGLVELM